MTMKSLKFIGFSFAELSDFLDTVRRVVGFELW